MPTTKHKIAEQVLELLKGGKPMAASSVSMREVEENIGQVINSMLKMEQLTINFPSGDTIPAGVMLASYEDVPVYKYQNVAAADLPAIPISLPRNMGIYHVGPMNDVHCEYIPVQSGQLSIIKKEGLVNELLGDTCYEPYNTKVVFKTDIYTAGITTLFMRLAVLDISQYSDFDILPIPSSMEDDVAKSVFKTMGAQIPTDRIDDPLVDNAVTIKQN